MEHRPTQSLNIQIKPGSNPDVQVVKLAGPMTISNFFDFQEVTRKQPRPRVLIVDLHDVGYIDSAALGSFVGLHVSCEGNGRKYGLACANDRLKNLFDLTRVKSFLVLFDSVADAEKHLN